MDWDSFLFEFLCLSKESIHPFDNCLLTSDTCQHLLFPSYISLEVCLTISLSLSHSLLVLLPVSIYLAVRVSVVLNCCPRLHPSELLWH